MKKLLLIRHAKSSWSDPDMDDHERPLNSRGERDAITMARFLADNDEALDVIYSSTAVRALDYAQLLGEFTGVTLMPDLTFYTFDDDELLHIIRHLPDDATRVAIVGHNPAITELVNRLTISEFDNVPTAGIASIDCEIESWQDINSAVCELVYLETPKKLTARY